MSSRKGTAKSLWREVGNWMMWPLLRWWEAPDGRVFLKVIDFPVPEDCGLGGESMWVLLVDGDEFEGTGVLTNEPAFCTEVKLGDTIRYGGGTDTGKPHYVEKVKAA